MVLHLTTSKGNCILDESLNYFQANPNDITFSKSNIAQRLRFKAAEFKDSDNQRKTARNNDKLLMTSKWLRNIAHPTLNLLSTMFD